MGIKLAERGATLVEALVALVILALLAAMAVPGWNDWIQRRRLLGVSAELLADLQYVRTATVMRSTNLRLSFKPIASGNCYIIHTGSAGSCSCSNAGVATCTPPAEALKTVFRPAAEGVDLRSNQASLGYSAYRGTVTPGATIRATGHNGITIQHVVNSMGRVRTCTEGAAQLGYPVCS